MHFLKKHWGNLLLLLFIALLFIPQTGMPIKVLINRIVAFSPSALDEGETIALKELDWSLMDLEGNQLDMAKSQGRVIVVNQWATWCPPCIAEMPSLERLYQEYGERVDFYFVSQEQPEKLSQFLIKKQWDLPVYIPRESPPAGMEGNSLPTTYLIDKNGTVRIRKTGSAKWDSKGVKELLDELL